MLIKKILVISILLLFIGVGIQPAIAILEPETSENDDCNLCPKKDITSQFNRLNDLIEKLDTQNNKLSIMSKLNPKIEEKYEEVSNAITIISEEIKNLNGDNFGLCLLSVLGIFITMLIFCPIISIFLMIWEIFPNILQLIGIIIIDVYVYIFAVLFDGMVYYCGLSFA